MTTDGMRLQKFLSRAGVASRREGERMMLDGRVTVNGRPVEELGTRVDPASDLVAVDGRTVHLKPPRWLLMNKPRGVITTRSDPKGRRTVYSLLSPGERSLRHVGRLDRDTEGLLLFTNEGEVHHALLHPSGEVEREYRAGVLGVPDEETLRKLEDGIELEDGIARAYDVRLIGVRDGRSYVGLVLREGRNREVRRLLAAVGHEVRRLRRVRFGPVSLGELPVGQVRALLPAEISALRRIADRPRANPRIRSAGRIGTP